MAPASKKANARAQTRSSKGGRLPMFNVFNFDGSRRIGIRNMANGRVAYEDFLVEMTDEIKENCRGCRELSELMEMAQSSPSEGEELNLRTKNQNYEAFDTHHNKRFSIESIRVLPNGNFLVSWPIYPITVDIVETLEDNSEDLNRQEAYTANAPVGRRVQQTSRVPIPAVASIQTQAPTGRRRHPTGLRHGEYYPNPYHKPSQTFLACRNFVDQDPIQQNETLASEDDDVIFVEERPAPGIPNAPNQ